MVQGSGGQGSQPGKRQLEDDGSLDTAAKTLAVEGSEGGPQRALAPPKPSPQPPMHSAPSKRAPKKATGEVSARKALCQRLLAPMLSAMKRRCGKMIEPFKKNVSKILVPDYNKVSEDTSGHLCLCI